MCRFLSELKVLTGDILRERERRGWGESLGEEMAVKIPKGGWDIEFE